MILFSYYKCSISKIKFTFICYITYPIRTTIPFSMTCFINIRKSIISMIIIYFINICFICNFSYTTIKFSNKVFWYFITCILFLTVRITITVITKTIESKVLFFISSPIINYNIKKTKYCYFIFYLLLIYKIYSFYY